MRGTATNQRMSRALVVLIGALGGCSGEQTPLGARGKGANAPDASSTSSNSQPQPGQVSEGGVFGPPNLCNYARNASLLVKAAVVSVGTTVTAADAGLSPMETITFYFNGLDSAVTPVTVQIIRTEFVGAGVAAPPAALMTFFMQGKEGPAAADGSALTEGLFFLGQDGGKWVMLIGGDFALDSATGDYWDGRLFTKSNEVSESDLVSKAEAYRTSTDPCWTPGCPNAGVMTDGGMCVWPDAGPVASLDGGGPQAVLDGGRKPPRDAGL